MLETRIEELTAAVKALTETILSARAISQAVEQVKLPEGLKEPKVKKSAPVGEQPAKVATTVSSSKVTETEVPNEKQPTTTNTSQPSESESAPVTYDDVKTATNALSTAKGRDVTIDALSRFGVKRATELDEGQWADYIAYTQEMIGVSMTGEEA